jgi:hypothetical protein|tara:strand:+ start:120 stop:320 length:201 start_codon:yes stop_codon:yes gene_type:complete
MKDIPAGKKGKGLSMLPTPVRNKMGFKKKGGTVKANKGKSVNLVCPRKEMAGALEMPTRNKKTRMT